MPLVGVRRQYAVAFLIMTCQRVVVVSACSKRKLADHTYGTPPSSLMTARDRYAGRAHCQMREAIDRWRRSNAREDVEWWIVSAKFGLVNEFAELPIYEATFAGLSPAAAKERGLELDLPRAFQRLLREFDTALVVLPLTYLRAAGAPFGFSGTHLYFASPAFVCAGSDTMIVPCGVDVARGLRVAPREVVAARFASFVADVVKHGLDSALRSWTFESKAA